MWIKETVSHREGAAFQKKQMRRLQSKSRATDATVWIGKQGPSKELMSQVTAQLKKHELVKLKVHKSALTATEISRVVEEVAAATGSTLIEVIGHTFTLFKRRQATAPGQGRKH